MAELAGCRVLLAEDEVLIAILIGGILNEQQCITVGPYPQVAEALAVVRAVPIDFALLDVDLCGKKGYPVAEELYRRDIPFLLLTGYGPQAVPREWAWHRKPFKRDDLMHRTRGLLRGR